MHLIKVSEVNQSEKTLAQAVMQITQMLGIYHTELARILNLQVSDIGGLENLQKIFQKNPAARMQAEKYIQMYECLYQNFDSDETKMFNWLRKDDHELDGAPLYLMVDELRIDDVIKKICP